MSREVFHLVFRLVNMQEIQIHIIFGHKAWIRQIK